jgi:hypothetical protein
MLRHACSLGLLALLATSIAPVRADTVRSRLVEGAAHGYLVLREGDRVIADGHFRQTANGRTVTSRIALAFADGSVHDESATFTPGRALRLESYHLLQKGASFPRPVEASIARRGGQYEVRTQRLAKDEEPKVELMTLPADAYPGMILVVLQEMPDAVTDLSCHVVGFAPKPRLLEVGIKRAPDASFRMPVSKLVVAHYVVSVHLGPLAELIASLADKEPEDVHVYVERGDAPSFLRMEGPLYPGGPTWVLERITPEIVKN